MTLIRRFFSGPSLSQAVLAAARHHEVDPDDLAYEVIDKKHGFLKTPRGVVIEVDPEKPTSAEDSPVADPDPDPDSDTGAEAPRDRLAEMTEPVAADAPPADSPAFEPVADESPAAEPATEPATEVSVGEVPAAQPAAAELSAAEPPPPESPFGDSLGAEQTSEPPTEEAASSAGDSRSDEPAEQFLEVEAPAVEPPAVEPPSAEPPTAEPAGTETAGSWWRDDEPPVSVKPESVEPVSAGPAVAETSDSEAEPAEDSAAEAAPDQEAEPDQGAPALDDDLRRAVAEAVDELVYLAGLRVQVASVAEVADGLTVELEGPDSQRVVAHGGRALLAIQHLLPRLLFSLLGRAVHCRLDCEGFHEARTSRLERLARKAADRVRDGGRSWLLEPMAPDERRLVHMALADESDVETESVGEGYLKRVRVARV